MILAELTAPTPEAWAGIVGIVAMLILPKFLTHEGPPRPIRWPRRDPAETSWTPRAGWEVRRRGGTTLSRPALDGRPPERMPAPRTGLSEDYRRYIDAGLEPLEPQNRAAWDQILWPERMRLFLAHHKRTAGGFCESGRRCGHRSQATQGHHSDYSELFHETRRTVKLVCRPCHVAEEQAKRGRP